MKQYKHKGSDFILRTNNDTNTLDMYDCEDRIICKGVPKSMVILGNDWEEIKEEDWIDKIKSELIYRHTHKETGVIIEIINKHLPKITDDMIEKIYLETTNDCSPSYFIRLVKHNLPKDLLANPE